MHFSLIINIFIWVAYSFESTHIRPDHLLPQHFCWDFFNLLFKPCIPFDSVGVTRFCIKGNEKNSCKYTLLLSEDAVLLALAQCYHAPISLAFWRWNLKGRNSVLLAEELTESNWTNRSPDKFFQVHGQSDIFQSNKILSPCAQPIKLPSFLIFLLPLL